MGSIKLMQNITQLPVETKAPKHDVREHSMDLSSSSDCASYELCGLWKVSKPLCVSKSPYGK